MKIEILSAIPEQVVSSAWVPWLKLKNLCLLPMDVPDADLVRSGACDPARGFHDIITRGYLAQEQRFQVSNPKDLHPDPKYWSF